MSPTPSRAGLRLVVFASLLALPVLAAPARAQLTELNTIITGTQEVPPTGSAAFGHGGFLLDQTRHELSFRITFTGLGSAETAAHIHCCAPPGVGAGIMLPLPTGSPKVGTVPVTPDQERSLLAGLTYVNIHSANFPNGEIRGQILIGPGTSEEPAGLLALLDQAQEVPPTASTATGQGNFTLDTTTNVLSYAIAFSGLSSPEVSAHIHTAPPGVNGPITFPLPLGSPKVGTVAVTPAEAATLLAGGMYVNIHSTNFPNGEIRGQMLAGSRTPQLHYRAASLDEGQEVPPTGSTATGSGCFVVDDDTNTLTFLITFTGLSSAEVSAHIHTAAPGVNGPITFPLPLGSPKSGTIPLTEAEVVTLLTDGMYVNVHSVNFPNGEIRGQIVANPPLPPFVYYCDGDGNAATACPCGNSSPALAREGCLSSIGDGGRLRAHGIASVGCDTLRLLGTDMPNAPLVYLQGTDRDASGGLGVATFDGLSCLGGTLVMLGTTTNVAGASEMPVNGNGPLSILGGIPAGGGVTRDYQALYRNAASFCTPGTANWTNAVEVVWVP